MENRTLPGRPDRARYGPANSKADYLLQSSCVLISRDTASTFTWELKGMKSSARSRVLCSAAPRLVRALTHIHNWHDRQL